jgi:hypothetical protein
MSRSKKVVVSGGATKVSGGAVPRGKERRGSDESEDEELQAAK